MLSRFAHRTSTFLPRLRRPWIISTSDLRTFKALASNSTHDLFAAPATGGLVNRIFRASPRRPTISFFEARGWTVTLNVTPSGLC
jgi:hypothetical protein